MKGDEMTVESGAEKTSRTNDRGTRETKAVHWRSGGLAVLLGAAAVALSSCSGAGSPSGGSSRTVASLGNTGGNSASSTTVGSGRTSSTTVPEGSSATRLADEWATCMRSHGDPNQADPTIDAYGVINITIPAGVSQTLSSLVKGGTDPQSGPCSGYLAAAQGVLRAATPVAPPPNQAEYLKYVDCMRANGVPNYPYPVGDKTDFEGTGVNPNSPFVEKVNNLCGKKIGAPAWWISGTGPPGDVSVSNGPIGGSNGGPPSCFYTKAGCPPRTVPGTNG